MLGMNNLTTAGEFFLIISGELILIFIAVSFLVGVRTFPRKEYGTISTANSSGWDMYSAPVSAH